LINSNPNIRIQATLDGSNTLFLPDLNETYHSLNGALSESKHVYIQNGLHLIKTNPIHILEIGFGTGLNALLTMQHNSQKSILYSSIEPFPLEVELLNDYYSGFKLTPIDTTHLKSLCKASSDYTSINEYFQFRLFNETIQNLHLKEIFQTNKVNLVYYDAFAPSRQAEMWDSQIFEKLYEVMDTNAILTTYCAQGQFKRTLKSIGFELHHPTGANGKREMTTAIKI
jgi:tRNA U34 5-methylaminomethyl-2-thiouridine-forming methyltransferase MnmC